MKHIQMKIPINLLNPVLSPEELEQLSRSELRKIRKEYHQKVEELRVGRDELNLVPNSCF